MTECCFDEWNSCLQVPLIKGKLSVSFSMAYNESDDDPVFKVISDCDRETGCNFNFYDYCD